MKWSIFCGNAHEDAANKDLQLPFLAIIAKIGKKNCHFCLVSRTVKDNAMFAIWNDYISY